MALPSLRHLCFPASRSRGRRYPELPHPYRNDFQRDRDRVVHARAFRRLEDKTQVFAPGLSDHFRNRLTHTIEVAQIARTVANVLGLEEDYTEALSLAHDVGHPPFGHAGEEELNQQMRAFGERFDHNQHALHLVEKFEQRYARFPGLNLTFEVREGIVKHSRDFAPGEMPQFAEYLPGEKPLLEAQLIDLCDEVAYNTADLDDAYSAKLFELAELAAAVPYYAELSEMLESQFPGAPEKVRFQEAVRSIINTLVSGVIEGTYALAMESGVGDYLAVRQYPTRLAQFTSAAGATNAQLKRFLRECVYRSASLVDQRQGSAGKIGELFQFFLHRPEHLPENYQEQLQEEPIHRVVCDYIAGMTDGYFRKQYNKVLGDDRSSESPA